jgi:hypothetical protein
LPFPAELLQSWLRPEKHVNTKEHKMNIVAGAKAKSLRHKMEKLMQTSTRMRACIVMTPNPGAGGVSLV